MYNYNTNVPNNDIYIKYYKLIATTPTTFFIRTGFASLYIN